MTTLFVIKGPDEGKRFELEVTPVSIGRDAGNTVRLHDTEISRRHAELRLTEEGYQFVDLGSSNGSFVNNQQVPQANLKSGDHIQIGQTILVYTAKPPESRSSANLAAHINMISKTDVEAPSAIVKMVSEEHGSRILSRPDEVSGSWLRGALANLSTMYQASQAVSHILDTDQLLEKIMDLIFETIQADRGCIMLRDHETGEPEPTAVRWRTGIDQQEKITISRTIMDHVLKEEQGVLVTDARHDERFKPAQSIVRYGIREAICVPMKGRHGTLGVLYLDTRTTPQELIAQGDPSGKLTEDSLMLAVAIGHQAALALEETRYHQALLHAERLAAVGQTIAAISHHIKNILQGLRTGNDLLKMGIHEKNETLLLQGWKTVDKNQSRIYDLVMDMLNYSKEREPALEPTEINTVIHEVMELVHGRTQSQGVKVQLRLADKSLKIPVDPEGLHRTLLNVIGNALDAVEEREGAMIQVSNAMESNGQWLRIVIADNGIGIPPEKLKDLFKPFISSKGSRGTGLGLAVSRKIMREHGGDIFVQSQVGKGSRFILRLPTHAASPVEEGTGLHRSLTPEQAKSD